ncbi:uncharacterized protein CLUP02_14088 [Colletotrichum lupini]|uniref:Zn(2)-C6 fungal-type domain-containing protein n=1 Tax=Colletotrichum lupini TaxID=145971 RepID=A0A9Q8T456_9PEZI|nr:uncharacterized protein CLUP02_14088 [Colletotrichum lupini]UQC88563.1 hypothetical protein CLUP02_14088 [Colletotrichum lupini]
MCKMQRYVPGRARAQRHEKCDDQQPRCSRCEKRNVECFRPERRPSFRQGSTANYDGAFSREQRWVNSRPRAWGSKTLYHQYRRLLNVEEPSLRRKMFDLCDEERHFQLVVVRRARSCQPLRDAIFAVAARHLCRHPKFRSEPGGGGVVVYQRHLLPDLTPQSAFEYMLRCIPALHEVSSTQDEEYRENLAAAALILRQFEEMDPEESQSAPSSDFGTANGDGNGTSYGSANSNVNFIDITKAILRAAPSSRWSGLLSAVYWVAVRQEIYFALTLGRSPQITARPDQGREVSFANRLIWFMSEVAKWKMGDRIEGEWERLRVEESILAVECTRQFIPIMQRPADRSQGEIFPLVCGQVSNRRAHREAEHQVREMTLELCGLAMHHLRAPPNLTTAGIGIMLYGDYFNDQWERAALVGVLEEWKSHHAWPVRKGYQALGVDYVP